MIVGTPYIRLITCSVLATFSELTYLVCAINKLGKIKIWNWFSKISSTSISFLININIVQQHPQSSSPSSHHHDHHSPLLRGKIEELRAAEHLVVAPLASRHLWWGRGKMSKCQNVKKAKWQSGKKAKWQSGKMSKCQNSKAKCRKGKKAKRSTPFNIINRYWVAVANYFYHHHVFGLRIDPVILNLYEEFSLLATFLLSL